MEGGNPFLAYKAFKNPILRWAVLIIGLIILAGLIFGVVMLVRWIRGKSGYNTLEGALSGKRWWHLTTLPR